ncbi:MAG: GEVED domain-containing protein, partial [Prevotellaceae bacterium]|nr:GEVED domain-containing protein [Prevotellaceae bacterium]
MKYLNFNGNSKPAVLFFIILFIVEIINISPLNAQYDLYGIWARKTGVTSANSGIIVNQMITDSKGNMYICGRFYGTVSLSDNTCSLNNSGGYPYTNSKYNGYYDSANRWNDGTAEKSDGFVSKYDNNGNWIWSVTVSTNVYDEITGISLSEDEESLVFLGAYGNAAYSGIVVDSYIITYGTGNQETLTFNTPLTTLSNFTLVKVKTNDGSKEFQNYLGYGKTGEYMRLGSIYQNDDGYIYLSGLILSGTTYYWKIWKYDFDGNSQGSIDKALATGAHGATLALSKNKSVSNLYLVAAHEASGPLWHTYLAKTDLTSGTSGYLSYISAYSDANSTTYLQNYGRYGIVSKGTDVNSADSHLFLVGYTLMDFVYQSINTTITNAGGEDGIIICYDPQNSDGATNMRWMVNLRAAGSQRIWDCKFDELTQTLQVVGSVDENEVDFNPKGVSNMQKSKSGTAMFYAVYDINGICLHVEIIESETGNEAGQTLDIAGDNISIFGTFSGSPFQVDPSERLEPLRTTQSSVFLAKYSTNPLSVPEPRLPGSYSAADKLKGTYGIAYHDVMPCLTLGALNNPIDYNTAFGYVPVNYANGTANPNYNGFDGAISYTSDYKGLQIKVKAVNAKTSGAYMAAWIDFNGNGIFDPGEVSEILPVPANTNTLSEFNLSWPALPTVSRANIDTYMRIRLTSEELSGSWGAGNAADGEVEDYAVSLNLLELSKTAVSSYITAPGMARLNDTITYTISLKNNIQSDILLFDPIPEGSEYYDSDPAGSLVNDFNFYGQTVPAVVWNLADLAPGERTFKFRALAKSKPTNSDSILNIAFAVMKGDTLASTGGNCSLAEIEYLSIIANNDYTNAFIGSSTSINVLDNDYYLPSCAATLSPTVTVNGTRGSATLGSDGTLSYTPTSTDFVGYDSITYQISCNGDATAKVYFTIIPKPDNVSDADCFIEAPELNWTIAELTPMSTELVNVYGPLTVGDLDNDGNIEVIILGTIGYSDYQCKTMKVFYYDKITNGLKLKKSFDFPGAMENDYRGSSVIFRHNGQGYLVVANRNDGYLYAFDVDGVPLWKSTAQFTTVTPAIANVGVADFNNDGVPEIYAGNAIFAYDGTFICRGSGNKGLYRYYPADRELLSTFAVDFDGDGKLELVAGMQIYDVNIAAAAMTVRTDWQLPAAEFNKIVNYTTVPSDGQSIAADIDNDGILEIVMSAKTTANKHVIVVWKPQPNNRSVLLGSFESTAAQHNTPMIGNLDDNPYMEIVTLNSGLNMYALRYDDTKTMGQRIVQKWNLTHTDGSGATGATLFDFDQDGTTEIVYRDEQRLRIIDGSGSAAVPKAEFDDVRSGTVREYPVIVDIDGDGQAEILVTGWTGSGPTGANAAFGPIRIFKSGIASSPWAPARSVWNQYMYNSVNVNEDLTIPAYQLNPATVFPGNDGQLGTSDDIRPYNNFLTQQTALNKNGTPLWLVPNAQLDTPDPTFNYYAIGDSLYIELKIKNIGNAALQAPVKITVHKDVVPAPAAARYTYQYPQSILQGASAEVKFSIPNYSSWIGAVDNDTKLILKINDNGNGYNDQPVCDSVNIKYEQALNALVFAKNDSIEYIQGIRPFDLIDVLTNDVIPAACTGLNPVVVNVAKGSA